MRLAKILATCLGIGYLQKGAGSVAALFCVLLWYLLRIYQQAPWLQGLQLATVFALGLVSASQVEKEWGHDSNRVVIDEWLGMSVTLFMLPFSLLNYALAFGLFRFFDIAKPFFIRRAEALPSGWGVMFDDLLAGLYSALILQLLLKSHLL